MLRIKLLNIYIAFTSVSYIVGLAEIIFVESNSALFNFYGTQVEKQRNVKRIPSKHPSVKSNQPIPIYRKRSSVFYKKILVRTKIEFLVYNA